MTKISGAMGTRQKAMGKKMIGTGAGKGKVKSGWGGAARHEESDNPEPGIHLYDKEFGKY